MNEIGNKFLLAGNSLPTGFTYSACVPFTKNKERIQKLKRQEIQDSVIKTN